MAGITEIGTGTDKLHEGATFLGNISPYNNPLLNKNVIAVKKHIERINGNDRRKTINNSDYKGDRRSEGNDRRKEVL